MTDILSELKSAWAHSAGDSRAAQSLQDHLRNVSQRAAEFANQCNLMDAGRVAGLWHDLGKATSEFQHKLRTNSHTPLDHKGFGAMWAHEMGLPDVALVIAGHHSGIPNLVTLNSKCSATTEDAWAGMIRYRKLREWFQSLSCTDLEPISKPDYVALAKVQTDFDLRVRMLFSCLVDADYLDTERHYKHGISPRSADFLPVEELIDRFFANQKQFVKEHTSDSELFALRCRVFEEAVQAGSKALGVYSLTVPTGGGKTRAALGFALEQVRTHKLSRVIVALPYTSILDQLAKEYSDIFGETGYLLHYTGWQSRDGDEDRDREMRLAAENWDAPLILTTTVQLFDSLFSNKPGDCRKLHNLANSVIVLDEVQTLPLKYLDPICDMLGGLVKNYGVSVLLSTATQPAIDKVPSFKKRVGTSIEIISNPTDDFQNPLLQRVDYDVRINEPWTWEKVADELLSRNKSGMVIVNTKAHALELYDLVRQRDPTALHLSTYLCGAHRRKVIEEIRRRLDSKVRAKCILISTQLVEAGVDIDFPLVMRAVGPLDRIVQAAGRCNREGKLGTKGGEMIVFRPANNKMPPGSYRTGADTFEVMYRGAKFEPDNPATFPDYFARLFQDVPSLGKEINVERGRLNFADVAEHFHLIEEGGTRSVFVGYDGVNNAWEGSPAQKLLRQLSDATRDQRRILYRRLQPYVVQVFNTKIMKLKSSGQILEDKATEQLYWPLQYDDHLGIAQYKLDIDSCIL